MTTPNHDVFPIQFPRHIGHLASPLRSITETPSWVDYLFAVHVSVSPEQRANADREIVELQAKAERDIAAARVESDLSDARTAGAFDDRLKAIMEEGS